MKNTFALIIALVVVSACTSRKHCNAVDAELIGAQDARAYDASQSALKRGDVCTEDYSVTSFRKDYHLGFQRVIRESCSINGAENLAVLDVARGSLDKGSFAKLEACAAYGGNLKSLQSAYNKVYLKGMCTVDKVKVVAIAQGSKLGDPDQTYIDNICQSAGNRGELQRAYKGAYADALKAACDFGAVKTMAQTDARKGTTQDAGLVSLGKCPGDQWNIKQLYTSTYDNETLKIKFEEEQRRREEAERKAAIAASTAVNCQITDGSTVTITVNNLNPKPVEFRGGNWEIRLLNSKGDLVAVGNSKEPLSLRAGESKTFKHDFYGSEIAKASQCGARYRE